MLKRIVALQSVVVLALAMLPLKVGAATTSLELVSQSTTGVESQGVNLPGNVDYHAADVSGDGRYIAFVSGDSNLGGQAGLNAVYVRDRQLNTTSVANVGSSGQQDDGYFGNVDLELSDNGGRMMFQSRATNLDPGTTNGNTYCYVRDFTTGQTQLVSIDAAGSPVSVRFCAVSGDGNVVAFSQLAGWVYV